LKNKGFTRRIALKKSQRKQPLKMSNVTYTAAALKPSTSSAPASLLREIFQATPLYIFFTAAKAAFRKPTRR